MKKGNFKALLPIGVFLVFYLGLGILFEYILAIPMGFYNVPIVVAFLAALLSAILQNKKLDFEAKLAIMANGVGDKKTWADTSEGAESNLYEKLYVPYCDKSDAISVEIKLRESEIALIEGVYKEDSNGNKKITTKGIKTYIEECKNIP